MNVGSIPFLLVFLPVVWALHWLLPRRASWQNAAVVAASWLFFVSWTPKLLPFLVATTLVNWGVGRRMQAAKEDQGLRGRWLTVGLVYDIGQLLAFKYLGFFAESLNAVLVTAGLGDQLPVLRFVLPLGISFWTIQHVAYLIDVYYQRDPSRPTLVAYAAFAGFFGQLLSGPIPRGRELLPQLAEPRRLTPDGMLAGGGAFFLGYVLKVFVGESWGLHVADPVFADPGAYSAIGVAMGVLGYTIQVFGDFAGYASWRSASAASSAACSR